MPALQFDGLGKTFAGRVVALHPLALGVPDEAYLTVIGPSGSGKTTLLRLIAGLDEPSAGRLRFDGQDVTALPPDRRGVAWLPQRPALYPDLTVAGNLAIGLELARPVGVSRAEVQARVRAAAERLGLTDLLSRRPHELSGGQQQRVALGRAIVRQARLWLLDEPFAHLDSTLRRQFRHDLPLLRHECAATIIHVTHDPLEALTLGTRVAVVVAGRLEQTGEPETVAADPATPTVADTMALLPWNHRPGVPAWSVRAEDVRFVAEPSGDCVVRHCERVGLGWLLRVRQEGETVEWWASAAELAKIGAVGSIRWAVERIHYWKAPDDSQPAAGGSNNLGAAPSRTVRP